MANPTELKIGYYVKIVGIDKELEAKLYKIMREEALSYVTGDESPTAYFSAVASGSESDYKNIEVLEPSKTPKHLAFILWGVKTGGQYYLKLPTGTNRFGTDRDKDIGYITNETSPWVEPNSKWSFWLINDYYPAINFINNTLFSITPQIFFQGIKYDIEEVTGSEKITVEGDKRFSIVNIGGIKGSE